MSDELTAKLDAEMTQIITEFNAVKSQADTLVQQRAELDRALATNRDKQVELKGAHDRLMKLKEELLKPKTETVS